MSGLVVFLIGVGAGLAVGFVAGAVWEAWMDFRLERRLRGGWSHHGYGPPQDEEEDR